MIEFLIQLIILCIIFGLIYYLVTLLPLPEPFKKIATIAVLLVFILILLVSLLGGGVNIPRITVK
jgi:hypothetical protein